jgi:Domain of unknown function (DUF4189)
MTLLVRLSACAMAGIAAWAAATGGGQAAGALAVGACAAYGYAFDYGDANAARTAAQGKCVGAGCKVVVTLRRSCAAFAIDGHRPCGPHGYASARRLGQAENVALQTCYKFGGKDCVVRAFACDIKG